MFNLDTLSDDDRTLIIAALAAMRQETADNLWNAEQRMTLGIPSRHDAEQLAGMREGIEQIDALSTRLVASMLAERVGR